MINPNITQKTVLIGMTGGIESTVAAYLLKKQGFKVIGIALSLFNSDDDAGPFLEYNVGDLNSVKEICETLDISFYAVNARDEFQAFVQDRVVGRVISGHHCEPIIYFNQMLLKVLTAKAKSKFQTDLVATGHYAKILKNQKSGVFELMTANDLLHDQSYELSGLSKEDLETLVLPLSELQKSEVLKIYKLIHVKEVVRSEKSLFEIMMDPRLPKFVEQKSSKDLRRPGNIFDHYNEASLAEHKGIHFFRVGMKNIFISQEIKIDPELQVVSIVPYKGNIFLDRKERLKFKHIFLKNVIYSHNLDISSGLIGHVKLSPKGEKYSCKAFIKNNNHVVIELDQEIKEALLVSGSFVTFYNRPNDKGKIFFAGVVEISGNFIEGDDYFTLPFTSSEEKREEGFIRKPKDRLLF